MSGLLPTGQPYESEVLLQDMILCYYKQKKGGLFPSYGEKKHRDVMVTKTGQLVIAEVYKTLFLFDMKKAGSLKSKKVPTAFNNTRSLLTIKFEHTHVYLVLIDEKVAQWMSILQTMAVSSTPGLATPGRKGTEESALSLSTTPVWNRLARPRPSFFNPRKSANCEDEEDDDGEKEDIYDFMEAVRTGRVEFFAGQEQPKPAKRANSKVSAMRRLVSKISFRK